MIRGKKFNCIIFATVLIIFNIFCSNIYASEENIDDKAVVFLLDASGSMNTNDPTKLALDSVMQVIYSLPSNYKVSVVAYSDDVILKTNLVDSKKRLSLSKKVNSIPYYGYTNATAGLKSALEILSGVNDGHIIMLSDGEILLSNKEKTNEAEKEFKEQVKLAKSKNIKVDFISFIDKNLIGSTIGSISKQTGGKAYYAPKATDIQNIIDEILEHNLNIKKSTLGLIESDGKTQNITVNFPFKNISKARILLTSSKPITNLVADFGAEKSYQDSGKRYSLIELNNPTTESVNITVDSQQGSKIKVELIPEYLADIKSTVKYKDEFSLDRKSDYYIRTANITFDFLDKANKNKRIFDDKKFENEVLYANINGDTKELKLIDGQANYSIKVSEPQDIKVRFVFKNFPANVLGNKNVSLSLEKPPLLERLNIVSYFVVALMLLILFMAFIVLKKKKKEELQSVHIKKIKEQKNIEKIETKTNSYKGKLNIYITKNKSGIDILPLTFNLFRVTNGRKLSLSEILNDLKVEEAFEGSDKIIFKPCENKNILIQNNSNCTVIKNRELILKNTSVEIFIDSKIDIIFEDEKSEMMIQYKDIQK